jgi:hypothetical protein
MSIVPKKYFINNEIPLQFNTDSFEVTSINTDNLSGLSLDISGQSNLNNLDLIGNLNSVNIINSGSLTSGALTSNSITCTNGLSSNTITSASTLTASNGFSVSAGTVNFMSASSVSFSANAIGTGMVNGLGSTLAKLQNLTGSVAVVSTISSNILTINYASNNGQSIFVAPTANFSLVLTNVPTTSVQAIYKLEIYCSAKFYCSSITVNGTAITMVSLGGFSNISTQVNANATGLIQTFTIFFTGTTTPSRVNTMLFSTW